MKRSGCLSLVSLFCFLCMACAPIAEKAPEATNSRVITYKYVQRLILESVSEGPYATLAKYSFSVAELQAIKLSLTSLFGSDIPYDFSGAPVTPAQWMHLTGQLYTSICDVLGEFEYEKIIFGQFVEFNGYGLEKDDIDLLDYEEFNDYGLDADHFYYQSRTDGYYIIKSVDGASEAVHSQFIFTVIDRPLSFATTIPPNTWLALYLARTSDEFYDSEREYMQGLVLVKVMKLR